MIYYELLQDSSIGRSTNNKTVAQNLGLTLSTDKEIVAGHDGKRYFKGQEPKLPEPSYAEKRMAEYPFIQDQLDMIYWDKVNGTNNWVNKIGAIKAKYPKE